MSPRSLLAAISSTLLLVAACANGAGTSQVSARSDGDRETANARFRPPPPSFDVAEGTERPHRPLTEDDIPPEAVTPTQDGTRGAKSLAGFLASVYAYRESSFRIPVATTVSGLFAELPVVVEGTITEAGLVRRTETYGGTTSGSSIHLRLTVEPTKVLKDETGSRPRTWSIQVFGGDPVLVGPTMEMLTKELGPGPIGSEVLLFGSSQGNTPSPGAAPVSDAVIYDGVVEDETGATRLGVEPADPPRELDRIDSALAAMPGR